MTKQECAIKYITENYLDFNRLRHDIVSDKLQIRMDLEEVKGEEHPKTPRAFSGTPLRLEVKGTEYWRELTKHDINSIVCHCAQEYDANITSREVMTALQSDLIPDVHPLREYIQSLRPYTPEQPDWIDFVASQVKVKTSPESATDRCEAPVDRHSVAVDGRLATPVDLHSQSTASRASDLQCSASETNYSKANYSSHSERSEADRLWRICFKKWFVAMVASWMKDEVVNHTVLVLVGRQGIFKTTWLDNLIPPELRAYSSKLPLSGQISKDDRLRLCENGLLNIDELDAICGREMNIVKSLLTSTDVNERAAYGRLKERRVRLASFCASTNKREFLTDITGNRRWLPFEVESIQNPFHTIIPYELLYAQAKALVEEGYFAYWFDMEEMEVLEAHNEEFRAQENEEQLLPILFDVPAEGKGEFMTTAEISDRLATYGGIKKPMSIRKLNAILEHHAFKAVRPYVDGKQVRGWLVYKRKQDEIEIKQKELANKSQRHEDILF